MKLCFRWYGENDPVTLGEIRQIPGMKSIVTAVYATPVGEVWRREDILRAKALCLENGMTMEVIESVPVHEDIKLGLPTREKYADAYAENIRRLGEAGVKCICYNFMPVFDWLRTDLHECCSDGSNALAYHAETLSRLDPRKVSLPGWDESYTPEELGGLLERYRGMTRERLFENLVWFLDRIMPACNEVGIDMAVHPDDPPWDVFGLPRTLSTEDDFDRLFRAVPNPHNGMTYCIGSLGAGRGNDLIHMAEKYAAAGRIPFAHLRNIRYTGDTDFSESGHLSSEGSLDMAGIVRALVAGGFDGYVRPDHGRNIWGEDGKPGYGLYDRALGATYLNGLFEMAEYAKEGKQ